MKTEQQHIEYIKDAFQKMQCKHDLLNLLNYAKPIAYGYEVVPFELKQLTWYSNPKKCKNRYHEFTVRKKSGSLRTIHAPVSSLKSLQFVLSFILQCIFEPHKAAMGFVKNKSIVDNAKIHLGNIYVYNIDLKDFFPSIDQARVWKVLQLKPFNLNKETSVEPDYMMWDDFKSEYFPNQDYIEFYRGSGHAFAPTKYGNIYLSNNFNYNLPKYIIQASSAIKTEEGVSLEGTLWLVNKIPQTGRLELANILAALCCTEMDVERLNDNGEWIKVKKNVLPQGAPTSPVITNIICQRLDYLLTALANRFGLKYTRYADDITFSSMHNVYQKDSDFIKELHRIITNQNFTIKESKTRLQKDGYRKEVTGLLVNANVNVQKRYIKQLRMWLYYWEKYGYARASEFFLKQYVADKGHVKNGKPDMANVINGKLDYLKMVKGADNELYLKLKKRFEELTIINKPQNINAHSVSNDSIISVGSFEIPSPNIEVFFHNNSNKLKININPIESANGQIKLKRQIVIKKGESLPHEELLDNYEEEEKEIDLSKHKPLDVSKFLRYFQNGKLKWLTHKYDEGCYNRSILIQEAKDEFDSLTRSLVIQPALYGRVNWFGFVSKQEKFYFLNKFHYTNWQSTNVLKWERENPNMHPINNDLLFIEMFSPFKKSIELKDKELKNIISNQLVSSLGRLYTSFDFEYNDLDNVNFYTDVDALKRGLSYLFNAIKQRSENSHKVKFNYRKVSDVDGRKRILEIIHINSDCNKILDKNELFKGDLSAAEKAFFGICDWSIISKSIDNSINKLNVLFDINSNKIPKEKIDDSLIEGFTHILTFYA